MDMSVECSRCSTLASRAWIPKGCRQPDPSCVACATREAHFHLRCRTCRRRIGWQSLNEVVVLDQNEPRQRSGVMIAVMVFGIACAAAVALVLAAAH